MTHAPHADRARGPGAPSSGITVRAATQRDLPIVLALRLALLHEHAASPIYGRLRPDAESRGRSLFSAQLESPREVTLLAERDGDVVGILRCIESVGMPLLYPSRYGYVSSVYVRPEARRSGVVRALLGEAEAWCAARGLAELRLHSVAENVVANATWDALGFEVVEHLRVRHLP